MVVSEPGPINPTSRALPKACNGGDGKAIKQLGLDVFKRGQIPFLMRAQHMFYRFRNLRRSVYAFQLRLATSLDSITRQLF